MELKICNYDHKRIEVFVFFGIMGTASCNDVLYRFFVSVPCMTEIYMYAFTLELFSQYKQPNRFYIRFAHI